MKRKKYDNLAFPFTSFLQESQAVLFLIMPFTLTNITSWYLWILSESNYFRAVFIKCALHIAVEKTEA